MEVHFSGDERILTMISLIRAVDPRLLRQDAGGFTVDFQSLERKESLNEDERLLMKMRSALETTTEESQHRLELSWNEGMRLADTLDRLEKLQKWPEDVLAMSRNLRGRLMGLTESA